MSIYRFMSEKISSCQGKVHVWVDNHQMIGKVYILVDKFINLQVHIRVKFMSG